MRNPWWAATALSVFIPGPAAAQEGADTSIVRRLERAESMIELLQSQIAAQAEARVEPRSRNLVELGGTVLLNGFYNNAKVNYADIPSYVSLPDPTIALPARAFGGSARQSRITLTAFVPDILGGSFSGEIDVDFAGGHLKFGRLFPLLHLRRTRAELVWRNAYVMVGQEAPPISGINPSTLAAIAIPGFTASGNLWFWIPQVRVGVMAGDAVQVGLETTALAPVSNDLGGTPFEPTPDRAERSGRPYLQGRLFTRWDQPNTTGEFSIGGHYGWLATPFDSLLVSRAAAATTRFSVTPYVEIRGEAFIGEALAGLGGGGIGQNLGIGDTPVRTKGGWAQLNLKPTLDWEIGGGYGFDNPDDTDLDAAAGNILLENVTYEGHIHWKPLPIVLGVEFRRIETTYGNPVRVVSVNHINFATGFEF